MPLVSVIIPTFNRETVLPKTLDSVLKQSYENLEIIVVDDASTDKTEEMLKSKYTDQRIKYFKLPQNQGVHAARNKGIKMAHGEYIIFLDSDDELLTEAVEKSLKIFARDEELGLVVAPLIVSSTKELTGLDRNDSGYVSFDVLLCGHESRRHKNSFVMLRKSSIGDHRFVMKNLDFIFYRYVGKNTKMFFHAEPLGLYHFNESAGNMSQKRKAPNIELSIKRARALADFIEDFKKDLTDRCPHIYVTYAYGAAVGLLLDGKTSEARHLAQEASKYSTKSRYKIFNIFAKLPASNILLKWLFQLKISYKKLLG